MAKKRKIDWFVEPLNSDTNEKMARYLNDIGFLIEQFEMKDDNAKSHAVFQMPDYSIITRFYEDKKKFDLKFKVYYRQKNHGPIKLWKFGEN